MGSKEIQKTYLEEELKKRLRSLSSEYYNHVMNLQFNREYEYKSGEMESWAHETLKRIFLLMLAYFECVGLKTYADFFRSRFEANLDDEKFMLEVYSPPFDDMDVDRLHRLREFQDFLMPFPEFDVFTEQKKVTSNFLEKILKSSHQIVSKTQTEIQNESSISNAVRWFVTLLFKDASEINTPLFPGHFTYYKGDFGIPEIGTAVEYKLIRKGQNPEKYIDQIRTDAQNYKGNNSFNIFYAVMYFLDNVEYPEDSVLYCWQQKDFPPNWHLIQVHTLNQKVAEK